MRKIIVFLVIVLLAAFPAYSALYVDGVDQEGTGITSLVSDTSPQLGGDLDLNNKNIYDAPNAFVDGDTTPDVSGGTNFITANTGATTISDFDGTPVDGQALWIIVNDANTTFDLTSSGLEGVGNNDYAATTGDLVFGIYSTTDNQWHMQFWPSSIDVNTIDASGEITGGKKTISVAASCTIGVDCDGTSTTVMYGGTIYVTGAATVTLAPVADGMHMDIKTIGAIAVSVDTNASDKCVYLDGATGMDDGDKVTNTSTTGDLLHIEYYSADGFDCSSGSPDGDHWTDGGA